MCGFRIIYTFTVYGFQYLLDICCVFDKKNVLINLRLFDICLEITNITK